MSGGISMPVNRRGMGHLRTSHVGCDHGIERGPLTSAHSGDQQQGTRGLMGRSSWAGAHGHGLQCSTWMASMRASSSGEILTSTAAISVFSYSMVVAPMIVEVRKGREL